MMTLLIWILFLYLYPMSKSNIGFSFIYECLQCSERRKPNSVVSNHVSYGIILLFSNHSPQFLGLRSNFWALTIPQIISTTCGIVKFYMN